MARVNQYECNMCRTREDAPRVETDMRWVEVLVEQIHRSDHSHKSVRVHVCPNCQPRLVAAGIPLAWIATTISEDNERRATERAEK